MPDADAPLDYGEMEYLIKVEGQSYLHVEWHDVQSLYDKFGQRSVDSRLGRWQRTKMDIYAQNLDRFGGEPFDSRYTIVDRVIASKWVENSQAVDDEVNRKEEETKSDVKPNVVETAIVADSTSLAGATSATTLTSTTPTTTTTPATAPPSKKKTKAPLIELFLVKWQGLSYSQCTWETAADIADETAIAQFRRFNRPPTFTDTNPSYTPDELAQRRNEWYKQSPMYKNKHQLRDYQVDGLNWLISAWYDNRNGILADEMGLGKCWAPGTLLMLYNGDSIAVENIVANTLLMGPDSLPRRVLPGTLIAATGDLYEITSNNAADDTWRCNLDHILVLRCNARSWTEQSQGVWRVCQWSLRLVSPGSRLLNRNTLPHVFTDYASAKAYADSLPLSLLEFECSLRDFLTMSSDRRALCTMFQPKSLNFQQQGDSLRSRLTRIMGRAVADDEVWHTAWLLGMWLTTGHCGKANIYQITTNANDPHDAHTQIVNHLLQWYQRLNGTQSAANLSVDSESTAGNVVWNVALSDVVTRPRVDSTLQQLLVDYNVCNNKHFPHSLLTESCAVRRALLAGIIDGDALFSNIDGHYEISGKERFFNDGLIHLCRGLGFTVGGTKADNELLRIIVTGDDLSDLAPYIQLTYKQCSNNTIRGRELDKDQRCAGFTIRKVAEPGQYYGFQLSGDGRCLLGDFRVTHNTVQCVSLLEHLRKVEKISGPFLVVVPLGTISHWKREIEQWTDMNVIIYHDTVKGHVTREMIRHYEFYFPNVTPKRIKFNVLVTTYEVLVQDSDVLSHVPWRHMVIDEGHRLKNKSSRILEALRQLDCPRRLLLTGTPIQNNTTELWTLLNFLEPTLFSSHTSFQEMYGQLTESQQVHSLQQRIRPFVLRRMKEAVEKSIPPKEETIIDIELTTLQKKYYRAIYEKNVSFLRTGVSRRNVSRLVNVEIELRKACNHPWLIAGAEEREIPAVATLNDYMSKTIAASGKMVLIDKLLPKLQRDGHRVLIFSQMIVMLDIIQEYCEWRGYEYERLDGGVRGNEREAAIDRFVKPNSNRFLFLLSTRAGGVGLNLATADTVIIFDSDWNPQQDMQAQARAHRIGQKSKVNIYRLVTRNTYESEMFMRASKKLGLDHAVLTNLELGRGDMDRDDELSIDKILRLGAYGLLEDDDSKSRAFEESGIDEILEKHAHVIAVTKPKSSEEDGAVDEEGNANGNGNGAGAANDAAGADGVERPINGSPDVTTPNVSDAKFRLNYSKMQFTSADADAQLDINDPAFWDKIAKSADMRQYTPDELLSQLTDGSAYESEVSKMKFVDQLTKRADEILTAKRNAEPTPLLDDFVSLLIQFSATKQFDHDSRSSAQTWLDEATDRRRQARRVKEDAESAAAAGQRRSSRRRAGDDDDEDEEEFDDGDDNDSDADNFFGGRVRGRGGSVMNIDICGICHRSGSLVACDGPCSRWFHLECTGLSELPDAEANWLCEACTTHNHKCQICGLVGNDEEPDDSETAVRRCSVPRCGHYYHEACLKTDPLTSYFSDAQHSSFRCPLHFCHRCAQSADYSMVHCMTCANAMHTKCMLKHDIRLTKRIAYCVDCFTKNGETDLVKNAIAGAQEHTQEPPLRLRKRYKEPRRARRSAPNAVKRAPMTAEERKAKKELENLRRRERRAAERAAEEARELARPFKEGVWTIRFKFEGALVHEIVKQPMFKRKKFVRRDEESRKQRIKEKEERREARLLKEQQRRDERERIKRQKQMFRDMEAGRESTGGDNGGDGERR